ncbi:S-adenosyl-L-methionine-dependent methyltransferase [Gloeopeniophorella convolvens]|nr:S-adenosyl-L-methionine-dependent methyltransferase [Gloeopeniophorella convolvens]
MSSPALETISSPQSLTTGTNGSAAATGASQDALTELKALANIIQTSIKQIEEAVVQNSLTLPSSEVPFSLETEAARMHPRVQSAGSLITSAAAQLMTLVRPAPVTVLDTVMQFHVSTAIRTALSAHVAEILRDAGPLGKHARDIAKPTKVHPGKLARILRLLSTNYIFTEVSPDVFANNRLSSVLDTGKPIDELLANPESKYVGTLGITSLMEHVLDEGFKASSYLTETILDPKTGHAYEVNKTALNRAFNVEEDFWEWIEAPGNRLRLARFGSAMSGIRNMARPDEILEGYAWKDLPEGSLVVDVGGGVGSRTLTLAANHPHLRFVVQDRQQVIPDAVEYWKKNMPNALESGRVKLQAQSFFDPQTKPETDVTVFFLCQVLHDWADEYCLTILRHLRAAAGPKTQLLLVDQVMSCACDEPATHEIPGAELPPPPKPLLPNMGRAGGMTYNTDIMMMGYYNGQERTVTYLRDLLEKAGWDLISVQHDAPTQIRHTKVIAVPL